MENDNKNEIHSYPLSEIKDISEKLDQIFKTAWVDTVEQAVAFIYASRIEGLEVETFLTQARDLIGEDIFMKITSPVPKHPLGCVIASEEEADETGDTNQESPPSGFQDSSLSDDSTTCEDCDAGSICEEANDMIEDFKGAKDSMEGA